MQQRNKKLPIYPGVTLLIAAAACLLGALVPDLVAAIIAGVLVIAAVAAFALGRAGRVLETILREELPPAAPWSPLPDEEQKLGNSQPETDFVLHEPTGKHTAKHARRSSAGRNQRSA
ncbi:MAG TPA: hypothetical protein VHX38_22720 [Pseudonocardiaceae bacterium]|jgi:DNA-binding transcriptional regulator YdaS (Cro superfamily)|nr:hypothetical protein [Pseudonocardiaceae bacterium]